ncbi:1,6-anhydro-N-acetylmuramyl-L-alanine amidase AmpD [Hydrogenovibrio sp. 3SP14C1]|uniref:1,6-anhydro-N-acetylmuramyl-L-alanine amidase AmpD n=1 Tax=Hydrogenovibrio sp. 3SP14C1 TaxID=3038774 RepID=UPI00241682F3|nr:1,6-anhydro-N-acetylmuramyl-L-alanine amidase AmpD [Hydrogenovibrio sp. 3SP14C1]MDG4813012.1 1,6-anhydro-N-acetylmuramyl-L-alanine amidase AmpD [Hydrogenovibrio sp. 3SP14C1]
MKSPLTLNPETHVFNEARYIESPNFDNRPDEDDLDLIVVHGISLPPGQFGGPGVEQLFTNQLDPAEDPYYQQIQSLKVSSHLFINRAGTLFQFVPLNRRAWHAGVSNFNGRSACNDFSIGIELEGTDKTPYTASQYKTLKDVISEILKQYPSLSSNHIKGHCDIAPGRKTDPGDYFMWQVLDGFLKDNA